MTRLTAACPEALIEDANQLAMCLAFSAADGETYRLPCGWQDAEGNAYSAASWEASDAWLEASQAPLTRPAWDVDAIIDMDAASRAQAAVVMATEPTPASPTALIVMAGMDGPAALVAMGLVAVDAHSVP